MPKFAANLSFLFTEAPFLQRFALAAEAGFAGVEFMSPYEHEVDEVSAAAAAAGVEVVLFNLPAGNWAEGERGLACLPGREGDFALGVEKAVSYAEALGCRRLHCLAGLTPGGEAEELTRQRYLGNLRHAARRFAGIGGQVLIEPINTSVDMPHYWLDSVDKALSMLSAIDAPNVALQLDLYHAAVMDEDLRRLITAHLPRVAHVQIADFPGRHEPGTGTIDFASVFAMLDQLGYPGWVGCEYRPLADTCASLDWMRQAAVARGEA